METKYRLYDFERNQSICTLMVSLEALSDSGGVTDFIARPDEITHLTDRGVVTIESENYLPDYWEGQ